MLRLAQPGVVLRWRSASVMLGGRLQQQQAGLSGLSTPPPPATPAPPFFHPGARFFLWRPNWDTCGVVNLGRGLCMWLCGSRR